MTWPHPKDTRIKRNVICVVESFNASMCALYYVHMYMFTFTVFVHLLFSLLLQVIPIFRPRFFSIPKFICPSHVIVLKSLVHNNGYSQPIVTATGGRDIRCATQFIHYRLNQRLMGMLGWIKGVCFHQRRRRRWWRRFGRCF